MNAFFRKLTQQNIYDNIPYDDLISKQRFALFRIYSFTAFVVSSIVSLQMLFAFAGSDMESLMLGAVAVIIISNFYFVKKIESLPRAYTVTLIASFLIVHIQSYTAGGIVNSGTMYLAVFILCAFMMLGTRAGKWFTVASIVHFIYLFILSEYTTWTSNQLFQNDVHLINQDFLTTGILAFILIAAQSSYLHSGKNVIIERITEQKDQLEISNRKLQEYTIHLEKTNKELDKFASIVSHDLKAPLRAIGNLTDWIEEDGASIFTPEIKTNFNIVKQRVKRMEDLIQAILDYSKADKRFGDEVQVDAGQLIQESAEFIGMQSNVKLNIGKNLPSMVTDKTRLQQVMTNLIGNAIKYNDKATPEITVSSETHENGWLFSVKDNGPGIDPQFHEKIFVIFQTLNRRDEVEGTGVGLAIVKKIIEDQGGRIWVESEPEKGADFKFFWPKQKKQKDAAMMAA